MVFDHTSSEKLPLIRSESRHRQLLVATLNAAGVTLDANYQPIIIVA